MHGIANSGNRATKFITTANPITLANVRAMVSAYYGGTNGIFVMAQDAYEKIVDLANANNSFNALKFHVINNEVKAFLFGYEILVKDCMNSGDIALIDPSAYTVVLIDPKTDVSSDVYFLTQENCYRSILRINGMPNWVGGITGQNGVTRYPFVMNASADEQSSSSSSSSSSSMD
jgi:hypothetical protein